MRPVAGVTAESLRRIQSLTYSVNTHCYRLSATLWRDRKRNQFSPQNIPDPDTHCLELNSEGLYNQREGTHPTGPWSPLKKGPPGPIPDSQVASRTSSGSERVPFLFGSIPLPTKGGEF